MKNPRMPHSLGWALGAILAALALGVGQSSVVAHGATITNLGEASLSLVHRISNAHLSLSIDWPLTLFLSLAGTEQSVEWYYSSLLALFSLGAMLLLWKEHHCSRQASVALGSLLAVAAHVAWQKDLLLLAGFAWFPWLLLAHGLTTRAAARSVQFFAGTALLLLLSILLCVTAQMLAIIPACLTIIVTELRRSATPGADSAAARRACILAALLLAPTLTVVSLAPPALVPDYPKLSHVVRDDGMIGIIQPVLGRDMPIQLLDRDNVKAFFAPVAWLLVGINVALLALALRRPTGHSHRVLFAALILSLTAVADTQLAEPLAQIMPLAVLSRLLPGMIYVPLVSFVLFAAVYLLTSANGLRNPFLTAVALLLITSTGLRSNLPGISPAGPQSATADELVAFLNQQPSAAVTLPGLAKDQALVVSPSHFPIAREGLKFVTNRARLEQAELRSAATVGCKARGSSSQNADYAVDGSSETRWTSSSLGQHGSEWIELTCPTNSEAIGISLTTGQWSTDFPRGLRISTGTSCDSELGVRYQNDSWQGAVEYSTEGYPHYQGQGNVKLFFRESVPIGCIRAEQIAKDSLFDWSIAEIFLIAPPSESLTPG